jgi:alginate O-acetyltransferase complex protein AlgI
MSLMALVGGGPVPLKTLVTASFVYSIVIWADFSGYSDAAIAASRLIGVGAPENFNRPYFAPNIREFWQRWHISFSRVLTSYLFVPISRALQRRLKGRKPVMVIAYLATFLACGYWHGPTANFLAWGAYHGVGLIVFDLVQSKARRRPGAPPRSRRRPRGPRSA